MHKRKIFSFIFWFFLNLLVIDVAVNSFFKYPDDPLNISPSSLQRYFEYGRSVEGKLHRMTQETLEKSAPIISAGWITNRKWLIQPDSVPEGTDKTLIAMYGMSHTKMLGEAIKKIDGSILVRDITAPGAPPSWTYAAYQSDKERHNAKVVIFGIMTDNISLLSATTGMTGYFDMSYPYTFPRYFIKNETLEEIFPPFYSANKYLTYLNDNVLWSSYRNWLKDFDEFYSPFLFRETILDNSCLVRVIRRAYSEYRKTPKIKAVYGKNGFKQDSQEVKILKKIISEFAQMVRERSGIPFIYIVNNPNRSDHLYRVIKPVVDKERILHLSTHEICPPDDPRLFIHRNAHFIPEKDLELAREALRIIHNKILVYKHTSVKLED